MNFKDFLPGVQKNILLRNYTTFKIGGRAKYFFEAGTKEDLISAIGAAKKLNLPFFILGNGSNLLVSDKGYKGLAIKALNSKFKILNSKIVVEAGTMLGALVNAAANKSLTGLEWASGIPGTVGGAVFSNAGSFGKSIKDAVKEAEVFNARTGKIKTFRIKDCKFSYRSSIFKLKKNLIILSVTLKLKKGKKEKIEGKIKQYLNCRKKTQPLGMPSAGSVFKNPRGFFAARLIEECGLKGKKIGKAQVSEIHANFIVNLGHAKESDVKKLIDFIKIKVKNKFGIRLKEEIQTIP